ncbi:hypothetical protein LGH83_04520 [Lichenihabitans sp. PAMC28606]|uniref:hypothetical protein n=1 Tax=Lichenihabitans sp. PAMC28606 TaxID=2880932 RepID=UPI001D0ACDB8|nr:hypothetical protein [Lichenihabitans sp. PAMC28606]UDL95491.1 hypothetical protein LGH83_04520 [Lichenihabitans sp. PAMC28606]
MSDIEAAIHARLDALHSKVDAVLQGLHHIISRGLPSMDHAALLSLAKTIDSDVDAAVTSFETLQTTHDTVTDALDDVGDVLNGIPAKLAKITGGASGNAAASVVLATVATSTSSPALTIPVSSDMPVAVGSTIAGPGIATGTTVTDVDPSPVTGQTTVTLSTATTADHTGGETLTVTPAS